tara:strand:+ start:250 stop:1026 length:777 start_codon:yes stop_codon:yes gene_type:complete
MNILQKICQFKRKEIENLKKVKTVEDFLLQKRNIKKNSFLNCLKKSKINLIAEIKRQSPSAGLIKSDFDVLKIAREYERAGAECLSILTENNFFGGDIHFIKHVKSHIKLPVLRKDFIIDEWQIFESYFYGADCILLIAAILNDKQIKKFTKIANDLNLDIILEVHDEIETKRAVDSGAKCIGVNNRNLKTLEINLDMFEKLSQHIPKGSYKIAESGLTKNDQLVKLRKIGADGFLIGEFLMKQKNIYLSTKKLINNE